MRNLISNTVRSPLLHFLVIGAAIYVAYGLFATKETTESAQTIRVTAGDIEWLETSWLQRWNRLPTPEERQGLIDDHVRQTVLYREAMAMGLDQDDIVIRRRLSQKLEFLFQDLADAVPPTDEELKAYFAENREMYRDPDLLTMTQVFVDPDLRGEQTLADAEVIRASLVAQEDPTEGATERGDPFMLQAYYPQRSELEIAKLFGQEFARSIFELEPEVWHGPVLSGYGVHLVYVHDRVQAPPAEFDLVVDRVREDWQTDKRQQLNDELVANLMARYEVVIETEQVDGEEMAGP